MKLVGSILCAFLLSTVSEGAVVYGLLSSADTGSGTPASHLFRCDLHGDAFVDLGSVLLNGTAADFDGLAASQEYGLLAFQLTPAGSRLVQIDPSTTTATLLAPPLFGREIRGATFGEPGQLWALDSNLDQLLRVSPTTGEELNAIALTLNTQPFDVPSATDLAVDFSGRLVMVAARDVYVVDPATGELSLLFADNAGEPFPASAVPPTLAGAVIGFSEAEKLFALDVEGALSDDLYTYTLPDGLPRALLFTAPLPQIDASHGDLALLLEPVASGDYNGDGVVNAADYTVWRDTLGSTTVLSANGNDSGTSMSVINHADYELWVSKFGNAATTNQTMVTAIPEPNHLVLLMLVLWARRMRRRNVGGGNGNG